MQRSRGHPIARRIGLGSMHHILLTSAIVGILFLSVAQANAQSTGKRPPKNPNEDVTKIGERGVGTGTFNMYTLEAEQKMGRDLAAKIEQRERIVKDPLIAEYVNRVTQNLARNSDVKVPVTAKVIHSPEINAMALPGGYMFVNTGLIEFAQDESELAGVLGHEIAHVAARHGARSATRALAAQSAAMALVAILGVSREKAQLAYAIAEIGLPMAFLKFSRDFERQADFLGVQYLYAAGYDPVGMVQFFERLSATQKREKSAMSGLFASHPMTRGRVKRVQKAIDELLPDRPQYNVTSSEFDAVKARLKALERNPWATGLRRLGRRTDTTDRR